MRNFLILFTLLTAAVLAEAQESAAPPSRHAFFPSWSPSGSHIFYYSAAPGNREVFALRNGAAEPVDLTNHPARRRALSGGICAQHALGLYYVPAGRMRKLIALLE